MNGTQCLRLLWYTNKKLLPKVDIADQHKFDQGHEFEEYVKLLYPKSVDATNPDFMGNLRETKEFIKKNKTIFEAGVMIDGLYVRCDLIKPTRKGWHLFEIKSTTQVKPQHIPDLAFQKYVLEKAGLEVSNCFLIYINKEYVKKGEVDPEELVLMEEVTEQVNAVNGFDENVKEFVKVMQMPCYDEMHIGQSCNNPYECPLKSECWKSFPENNVLQLTNWRVYWKLFEQGIYDIKDIPADTKLNEKDQTLIKSLKKSPQVNKQEIKKFLGSLNYPLYYFDFETFDTAIPIYDKSRPYQKIAFQYSLHIEQKNGKIEHKGFLATGEEDPRIEMLKQMKKDLKGKGDIVVFNKSFEISVLRKLVEDFPSNKKWLFQTMGRIVDLAEPFRLFYYYDKSQKGSYSIKKVLPAITGKSYSDLEIGNGADASSLYFYSHIVPRLENKEEIRKNLEIYCGLDTEGMIWIIQELTKI